MPYVIQFTPRAEKEFLALPKRQRTSIKNKIDALAINPRPIGSQKLKSADLYKFRDGNYRVIYQIQDKALIITVIKVANRQDVYRDF